MGSAPLISEALTIQRNLFDGSFHCGVLADVLRMDPAATAAGNLLKKAVPLPAGLPP